MESPLDISKASFTVCFVMNIELKSAWYSVVVIGLALIGCVATAVMMGIQSAFAPLGLLGLLGFTPLLFRKRKGVIDFDERDLAIAKSATVVGGVCSYLAVVLGAMTIWIVQYFKGEELISVHLLPLLVAAAMMVLYLARSVFIISQYSERALGTNE
jgi:hypothetical protein